MNYALSQLDFAFHNFYEKLLNNDNSNVDIPTLWHL